MARRAHNPGGQFGDMAAFRRFALAGNAVFTLVSKVTGSRFTYRIRKGAAKKSPYFVQLLTGPDNTLSYSYFGVIFGSGKDLDFASYRWGGDKAKVAQSAPGVRALEWVIRNVISERVLDGVEIWHEGKCGKCRKALTVPESIQSGLGPVCARGGRD